MFNDLNEKWQEINIQGELYEVSDQGRARTRYHGRSGYLDEYRYINLLDNGKGYLRFNIRRQNRQTTVYIHRLVAEAFIPNPSGYTEINHIDEDKTNNRADNLEWCDHIYNCRYGSRSERVGAKHMRSVRCIDIDQIYPSLKEAAETFGVRVTALSNCLKGRSQTCAGHRWEYVS